MTEAEPDPSLEAAIGLPEMRALLSANKLRVLSPAHLQFLCDGINALRLAHHAPVAEIVPDFHNRAAEDAAQLLWHVIPRIQQWRGDGADGNASLDNLRDALFFAREHLSAPRASAATATTWHLYADRLAQMFQFANEQAFGTVPALSNDGPVLRFVLAAIAKITGEAPPSPAAVIQFLKRERQKRKNSARNAITFEAFQGDEVFDTNEMLKQIKAAEGENGDNAEL